MNLALILSRCHGRHFSLVTRNEVAKILCALSCFDRFCQTLNNDSQSAQPREQLLARADIGGRPRPGAHALSQGKFSAKRSPLSDSQDF